MNSRRATPAAPCCISTCANASPAPRPAGNWCARRCRAFACPTSRSRRPSRFARNTATWPASTSSARPATRKSSPARPLPTEFFHPPARRSSCPNRKFRPCQTTSASVARYGLASWAITARCPSSTPASRASTRSAGTSPNRLRPRMRDAELGVGGLTPFTTIDFPGRLAAVVFCQGCPWRCGYCHNPHLHSPRDGERPWGEVLGWLETRRGLLDGVVFSGGEPLLQRGLAAVLPALDWVGFDVKGPFEDYRRITGAGAGGEAARDSLARLLAAGVDHE